MLNAAGSDGWEFVSIASHSIAYLKRPIEEPAVPSEHGKHAASFANGGSAKNSEERELRGQEVKAKYRDPNTNESGRGRMSNWLKRKQDAGEDIGNYLV
jgi:H-NS histone family